MQQSIVLPYLRTTPIHHARRDLWLAASDSLSLRVTVVEYDDPTAPLLVITGGLGGPHAQLVIWADTREPYCGWDYARPPTAGGTVLWTGAGTPQTGLGAFDFFVPIATFANFPRRCGWAVQLAWDAGDKGSLLSHGIMHIRGPLPYIAPYSGPLLTDTSVPVLEDDLDPVFT
jgi:hypothetical protein